MEIKGKATRIDLFNFSTKPMRAFHMTWFAFFLCFFAWFGIAPLMAVIREELQLTKEQIGNTIIASVAITIIARLAIGWICDKVGPRRTYTWLLILGSLPVMGIGLAKNYETFLIFRLLIGGIGASFVITQYHTSVMFAPNCVGTANATSAGWGNLGGGVTQMIMPLIFAAFIFFGFDKASSWRLSMIVAGAVCMLTGVLYYFLTTDFPGGNYKEMVESGEVVLDKKDHGSFLLAAKDYRVWALFIMYAACFGIELTINNIAALYFKDYFGLGLKTAGLVAGLFGLMNIFARTMGGVLGDKLAANRGLKGRVQWLFVAVMIEGIALILFSKMTVLPLAIGTMIVFSLFVQMSEGATYSVVPFINKKAMGSVAGIVGAGGNLGAVSAGFLFRSPEIPWNTGLFILGITVCVASFAVLLVRFSKEDEEKAKLEFDTAIKNREADDKVRASKSKPAIQHPAFPELIRMISPMDALRMYLGAALTVKGIYFIINTHTIEQMAGTLGSYQNITAWWVILAHVIGGSCLMIGLGTRWASLANITVLLGAIFFVHLSEGMFAAEQGLQFSLFVLFALLLVLWKGAGKFSVDNMLGKVAKE